MCQKHVPVVGDGLWAIAGPAGLAGASCGCRLETGQQLLEQPGKCLLLRPGEVREQVLFISDKKTGDVTGHGVNGFGGPWYVVAPAGMGIV